jgi:hypothetical protein
MSSNNIITAAVIIGLAIVIGAAIISYNIPRYQPVTSAAVILDTKTGQLLTCDTAGRWEGSDTGTNRDIRISCGPERRKE